MNSKELIIFFFFQETRIVLKRERVQRGVDKKSTKTLQKKIPISNKKRKRKTFKVFTDI